MGMPERPRVDVLALNLALDEAFPRSTVDGTRDSGHRVGVFPGIE